MTASCAVGEFRISGLLRRHPPAATPDDRVALIDEVLHELPDGPMFLEIKRDARPWAAWEQNREHREFLRVGIAEGWGAAEYVNGPAVRDGWVANGPWVVRETVNPTPDDHAPRVESDSCVPTYFPMDSVVPLDHIRDVMIEFALRGALSDRVQWRDQSVS